LFSWREADTEHAPVRPHLAASSLNVNVKVSA
jgi:hypothetical protein